MVLVRCRRYDPFVTPVYEDKVRCELSASFYERSKREGFNRLTFKLRIKFIPMNVLTISIIPTVLLFLLLLQINPCQSKIPPNPNLHPVKCHNRYNNSRSHLAILCDVDDVMLPQNIWNVENTFVTNSEYDFHPYQFGIAVVRQMDKYASSAVSDDTHYDLEEMVGYYARKTHDVWGVGQNDLNNGILLYLAVEDRVMYISVGKGVEDLLTWWRLDRIMKDSNMKSMLRRGDFEGAILCIALDIRQYLFDFPLPTQSEKSLAYLEYYLPLIMILCFSAVAFVLINRRQRKLRREYALVRSHLSQMERDHAAALQGKYQCSSCPICLEDFQCQDESGFWTKGSDGNDIKLLRCGHAFDESCWVDWVDTSTSGTGNGDPTKCPICREDVSDNNSSNFTSVHTESVNTNEGNIRNRTGTFMSYMEQNNRNEIYSRELRFRLSRLQTRYPRFINNEQVQRWSQQNYDGSMVKDKSFQNKDPSNQHERNKSNNNMSSSRSGFGGGTSSSGRSSRW